MIRPLTFLFIVLFVSQSIGREPEIVSKKILESPTKNDAKTLVNALNGADCRPEHYKLYDAILKIGPHAVPELVTKMNSDSGWWIQLECVYLLGLIGPDANQALDVIKKPANGKTKRHYLVKKYIAVALQSIKNEPKEIAKTLEQYPPASGMYACKVLSRMGQHAKVAEPLLTKMLKTAKDHDLKQNIIQTLKSIKEPRKE